MNCNFLKLSPKDIKKTRGFIALFDILGYRDWIKKNNISKVAIDHKNMKRMITTNVENQMNYALQKGIVKVHSYADTFLIYTNEISRKGFAAIMHACRGMFESAICFGLPIRGTVTCGYFFASEDIITGQPLIEAFQKEKEQEWIGCWITDQCLRNISEREKRKYLESNTVVRYPIPFKKRKVSRVYAYNWVSKAIQNPVDIDLDYLKERSFLKVRRGHRWPERRKIDNTIIFYKFMAKSHYGRK